MHTFPISFVYHWRARPMRNVLILFSQMNNSNENSTKVFGHQVSITRTPRPGVRGVSLGWQPNKHHRSNERDERQKVTDGQRIDKWHKCRRHRGNEWGPNGKTTFSTSIYTTYISIHHRGRASVCGWRWARVAVTRAPVCRVIEGDWMEWYLNGKRSRWCGWTRRKNFIIDNKRNAHPLFVCATRSQPRWAALICFSRLFIDKCVYTFLR